MENRQKITPISPYDLGQLGEELAREYLRRKKYRIVAERFRLYRGEIDLIAFDKKTLVFIEVKSRRKKSLSLPQESVTFYKQKQIRKIAQGFLAKKSFQDVECRFDVISIIFNTNKDFSLSHIKNAF